jgi:hypothetical protein
MRWGVHGVASPRLVIISLLTIALGASLASGNTIAQNLPSTSVPSGSATFLGEVAAASDSRGRVHALWTEKGGTSGESSGTLLRYSTYDPQREGLPMTFVVDSSPLIYSLALTVDEHDSVHAVWVSATESFQTVPGVSHAVSGQGRLNAIYYLTMDPGGIVLGTRRLLFSSQSESVWVSLAAGKTPDLYVVWIDVHRVGPTREESATYYMSLQEESTPEGEVPTLVAKNQNPSKMLKAAVSPEQKKLYLAWVDGLGGGRFGITCSSVDLSNSMVNTVRVEEVEGDIDKLALRLVHEEDFVVLGWAYEARLRPGMILGFAKLAYDEMTVISDADLLLPGNVSPPESMSIDSRGNFHIVWVELAEDLHVGSGPSRVKQPALHCAVLDDEGRFSTEERRPIHLPLTAAFVVENGDVYVVSDGVVLQTAEPMPASSSSVLILALVACACLVSGMRTEAGSYFLAQWKKVWPTLKKRHTIGPSESLEARLIKRIRAHPGITLFELSSATSLGTLDLASHLRLLEASGTIRSLRHRTKLRFYCLGLADAENSGTDKLRSSIIRLVEEEPGITETNIARRLGMSQQLANYHLKLLGKAMVLFSRREEGRVSYFLNERAIPPLRKGTKTPHTQDAYKWRTATTPS